MWKSRCDSRRGRGGRGQTQTKRRRDSRLGRVKGRWEHILLRADSRVSGVAARGSKASATRTEMNQEIHRPKAERASCGYADDERELVK